jgi:halimadienyl-diphosphate synthase
MDVKAQASQLVRNLDGCLSISAYDVAWMARVCHDRREGARWPEMIGWLLDHQWPDGSWGGTIPYYHDRLLCTMSAILALKEMVSGRAAEEAIERGVRYVWRNSHLLRYDPIELVGFELILPTLLAQARTLDLKVPAHSYGYRDIRTRKLGLLPPNQLYKPGTSVAFSIEFLDSSAEPAGLSRLQGDNGSIANSPATTAYLLLRGGQNERALRYLDGLLPWPPAFHPWRILEIVWTLEHLLFGGLLPGGLAEPRIWAELQAALADGEMGVGIDPAFGINDGDTTSVTLHVMAQAGHRIDPAILRHFENPRTGTFHTFPYERNPSVVTNAHALEALALMPDYPDRREIWNRVVTLLLAAQHYKSYWVDKWHASPYYATAHVLIALIGVQEPLLAECHNAVEWLIYTQRSDGSWGFFDRGTGEETAYALLALLQYHRQVKAVDTEVLSRGFAYLDRCLAQPDSDHPELWIAKSLYAPRSIIQAAFLAAAALYQETFGQGTG